MDQAATVTDVTDTLVLGDSGRVLLLGRTCAAGEGFPGLGCLMGFQWADLEFSMLLRYGCLGSGGRFFGCPEYPGDFLWWHFGRFWRCLPDFGHSCHRLQWGTGFNFLGPGLAHWWLGDITCLGIPFLMCVRAWRGCFPGSPGPPCIVGLH